MRQQYKVDNTLMEPQQTSFVEESPGGLPVLGSILIWGMSGEVQERLDCNARASAWHLYTIRGFGWEQQGPRTRQP